MVSNNDYSLKSYYLYESGNKISKLLRDLKLAKDFPVEYEKKLIDISERYHQIIESCPENHQEIDHSLVLSREKNIGIYSKARMIGGHYIVAYGKYSLFILVPPLIFITYFIKYK